MKWLTLDKNSDCGKFVKCDHIAYNSIGCITVEHYIKLFTEGLLVGELLTTDDGDWIGYYHMYRNLNNSWYDDKWLLSSIVVLYEFQDQRYGTFINDRVVETYGVDNNIAAKVLETNKKQYVKYTECYGFVPTGEEYIEDDGKWLMTIRPPGKLEKIEYSLTHNNHYLKGYNDDWSVFRVSDDDVWNIDFDSIKRKPMSWKNECINSAKLIRDRTDDDLWVLLSGGIDSEVVLRSFHLAGIPVNVAITQFENDYNAHDVSFAVDLCDMLDIKYHIIDINVVDLWENDFWNNYSKYQMKSPMSAITMETIMQIDGLPILGLGDGYISRHTNTNDFYDAEFEYESTFDKFLNYNKRYGISSFFQYTPEHILSFLQSYEIGQFILNSKRIKLSYLTPWKWKIYKEHFPDIKPRLKYHGFEVLEGLNQEYKRLIADRYMKCDVELEIPHDEYIKRLKGDIDV
jgi:hypothetical protein